MLYADNLDSRDHGTQVQCMDMFIQYMYTIRVFVCVYINNVHVHVHMYMYISVFSV